MSDYRPPLSPQQGERPTSPGATLEMWRARSRQHPRDGTHGALTQPRSPEPRLTPPRGSPRLALTASLPDQESRMFFPRNPWLPLLTLALVVGPVRAQDPPPELAHIKI